MNHRRSPKRSATRPSCRAARQIVLLPIPGAPSTATGSGGVPSHACTSAATSSFRPDQIRRAPEASPHARPGRVKAGPARRGSCSACSSKTSSCSGLANFATITPAFSILSRNCPLPLLQPRVAHRSAVRAGSAPQRPHRARTPAAAAPPRSRRRIPARYRTPPAGPAPAMPYRRPIRPTYTSQLAHPSPGSSRPAWSSRAGKYAMSRDRVPGPGDRRLRRRHERPARRELPQFTGMAQKHPARPPHS